MQNKLFVRNLSFSTDDAALTELFEPFGVTSAKVAVERDTGRGRGFAFVEMKDAESAENAIKALDGKEFGGRTIQVAISEPRPSRPDSKYR